MNKKTRTVLRQSLAGEKGLTLISALIFLMFGSFVITPLLSYMSIAIKSGQTYQGRGLELYAADAGVEDALWSINNNVAGLPYQEGDPAYQYTVGQVNGESVSSTITYVNSANYNYKMVSVATSATGTHTTVTTYINFTAPTAGLFDAAVQSVNGTLILGTSAKVNGNIIANGNITIGTSATVSGNASVTSGHSITDPGHGIHGSENFTATLSLPPVDTLLYLTQVQAGQVAINGIVVNGITLSTSQTLTLTGNPNTHNTGSVALGTSSRLTVNGSLYVDGNITLGTSSTMTVNGNLYVVGSITTSTSSKLIVNGALYVGSYFNGNTSSQVTFGGATYVNGTLSMGTSSVSSGQFAIVAKGDITMGTSTNTNTPFISEQGNIDVATSGSTAGYLYAPNGSVTLETSAKLSGAAVGKSVSLGTSAQVTYVTPVYGGGGVGGLPGAGSTGGLKPKTWAISTQ